MEQGFFSTKGNRVLGALVLVMVILGLASWIILNLSEAERVQMPASITVEGKGEVVAVPDIGTFSFSVEAEADTADEAQGLSAQTMNEILTYLNEAGVAENDIKTTNYNLYPKYRYEERICAFGGYCPPGEQVQDGFTVSQMITVKVRNTEQAGDLIAGVGDKGATNISSLNFTIDDMESLRAEAREKAIADARKKAEKLANDLDVRIVGLAGYYENGPSYGYGGDHFFAMEEKEMLMNDGMSSPELPVGEDTTMVTVSITYEVR